MLDVTRIPEILRAYSKLEQDTVLDRFAYEHSLIFNMNSLHITGDWLYAKEGRTLYWSPINLIEPNRNPEDFIDFAKKNNIEINTIAMLKTQKSKYLDSKYIPTKHGSHVIYIYDNNEAMLNSTGKDYERFRVARKYLNDEDITIDVFCKHKPIDVNTFNDINNAIEVWKEYERSKGFKVNYRPIRVTENLIAYGEHIDFVTMVIRYKGELLSFFTSERLHENYVILTDGKFNFGVTKDIERKFQYIQHLQHWLHLKYWHDKLEYKTDKMYFNIGMSGPNSYKNRLRPIYKQVEYRYDVKDEFAIIEKSSELF